MREATRQQHFHLTATRTEHTFLLHITFSKKLPNIKFLANNFDQIQDSRTRELIHDARHMYPRLIIILMMMIICWLSLNNLE
jgi:hypothetical protein